MDNEQKPEKPYTRYKSSRIRSRKPLKPSSRSKGKESAAEDAGGWTPESAGEGWSGGPPESGRRPPAGPTAPRRKRRWGRWVGYSLLILLLLALIGGGISYWRLDRAVKASNAKVPADVQQSLDKSTGGISSSPVNILFLGSDQRPGENARSDTILLMRIDGQKKTISQLSIPRDTLVDIPGYGQDKINAAYAWGGPALTIKTVEQLTGLPIHHYIELNFSGFPSIVDSLGGVDIDVPKTIDSQYPSGLDWTEVHFDAGPQHMSGDRALVFVRVRYSDDDFQRMGRQQLFMEALQKKVNSPFNLARMPLLAPGMIDNITTDLSTNDLMRLGWIKFRTPADNNRKFVLAGSGEDIGGVSYVVLDEDATRSTIRDFLSG
ncbi:MAG: LCP family protein [Thermoleophilia bacterium]